MLALSKADLVPPRGGRGGGRARGASALGADVPRARHVGATARRASTSSAAELLRRVPLEAPRAAPTSSPPSEELAEHRVFRPGAERGWQRRARRRGRASACRGAPVERLLARHDLDNDEALAHVERRLHRMGVIRALEAAGFEPGDDVEIAGRRVRARSGIVRSPVARYVVKLGSSIVAEDSGELRADVLARVCDEVAARHAAGDEVVIVTSGAIARGMRVMDLPRAPAGDRGPAGRERRRPGQAVPRLRRAAARARRDVGAGAADVLRHERAHALPQRAPDAAPAARLARRAGHQRERHDDDRRDLLRRQRLPRRAGGDPHRRRPARAAHRHRRPVHRRPARRPGRAAAHRGRRLRGARRAGDRPHDLAARLGRDALEGRRGRDGDRGRASPP